MVKKRQTLRGNDYAVKHGGYRKLTSIDRRSREGKILSEIESALVTALGGNPSPQEILIIKRAAVKALRCAALEDEIVQDRNIPERLPNDYLRWARELTPPPYP